MCGTIVSNNRLKTLNAKMFPNPQQTSRITFFKKLSCFFASLANTLSEIEETLRALHQVQTAVPSSKKFDTSKYIH